MSELEAQRPTATAGTNVLIVGAGPTGLMAAGLLARHEVPFRIIDKSPGPAKESRAMVVQARSLELLHGMGLAEAFLARGVIVTGAQLSVDGRPAAEIAFDDIGRVDTPFAFPLIVPQSDTEAILAADLERLGVQIEYGATLTELGQGPRAATATVAHAGGAPETIEADYVIGADGAHSLVRKALGLTFEGAAYVQEFLLADCRVEWPLDHDRLMIFLHETQLAAYLPMRGSERARLIVVAPGQGERDAPVETQGSTEVSLDEVEKALRGIVKHDVILSDATWTSRYRVHHRGVDRYGVGRVFVAGDAAHIHSPAGGQGMNTGLQDAANLAWKLAAVIKGAAPELLESYHAERWPVGRKILERTDKLFAGMTATSPLFAALRNAALPLVAGPMMRSETMRARAFHFISELGIRYHAGAFVEDDCAADASSPAGFRAGSRAPDGRISRTITVFDLLDCSRFTVLAVSSSPLNETEVAHVAQAMAALPVKVAGLACDRYLVTRSLIGRDLRLLQAESADVFKSYRLTRDRPQALFLVRPDGYIAYRSERLDFGRLRAFIERLGAAPPEISQSGSA